MWHSSAKTVPAQLETRRQQKYSHLVWPVAIAPEDKLSLDALCMVFEAIRKAHTDIEVGCMKSALRAS